MVPISPPGLKDDVLTLQIAEFTHTLPTGFPEMMAFSGDKREKVAYARYPRRWLRANRNRPRR